MLEVRMSGAHHEVQSVIDEESLAEPQASRDPAGEAETPGN
jgi:hypothetical protein